MPVAGPPTMPHCDQAVLHAPGECTYCDAHPDWQELRQLWGIAFTGHTPKIDAERMWLSEVPVPVRSTPAKQREPGVAGQPSGLNCRTAPLPFRPMADDQTTPSPDEARDALLDAIKRGADHFNPQIQPGSTIRDLAEAYAFVTGKHEPGTAPKITVRR
ncbi:MULTISPECIES: hypothetical protein [Micromonospora]|uniref:hypothetical protein n=1 Tax=Micromonospora TaxID=1873 RepID=UPI0033EEDA3B